MSNESATIVQKLWNFCKVLRDADLQDFINVYNPENRHQRVETERFRAFSYEELTKREHANLDIFWLREDSVEDLENLPPPEVLASEITLLGA